MGRSDVDETLAKSIHDLEYMPRQSFDPSTKLIHSVILGQAYLLKGDFASVLKELSKLEWNESGSGVSTKYTKIALIKRHAILGVAHECLGDIDEAIANYTRVPIHNLSELNSSEAYVWAERTYYRFGLLATSSPKENKDSTLKALRGYHDISRAMLSHEGSIPGMHVSRSRRVHMLSAYLSYLSAVFRQNPKNSQIGNETHNVSVLYEKFLYDMTNFPTASESNEKIEQYTEVLMTNWNAAVPRDTWDWALIGDDYKKYTNAVLSSVRRALAVTFQSCSIMRQSVVLLLALREYDEAFAAFDTYLAYQDQFRIHQQSGGEHATGDTALSLAGVSTQVINVCTRVKKNGDKAKAYSERLLTWLPSDKDTTNNTANGSASSEPSIPSLIMAQAYGAIGSAFFLHANQSTDEKQYNESVETAAKYYQLSTDLGVKDQEVRLEHAIFLARSDKISEAVELVKKILLDNESHIQSWHLLALLLTTREEYDKAMKVVETTLHRYNVEQLKIERDKHALVQVKLTHIALIEAVHGSESAIGELANALGLVRGIYPDENQDEKQHTEKRKSHHRKSLLGSVHRHGNGHSRSKSEIDTTQLAEDFSKTGIRERLPKRQISTNSQRKPVSEKEIETLRYIWLVIAGVYRRAGLAQEADQAIVEAESIAGPSAETHSETGLLVIDDTPSRALDEFEAALDDDKYNLKAILGLSQLVLKHSKDCKDSESESSTGTLFQSEKDASAAHARIRLMLSMAVKSAPGRYTAEAWWLLSQVYELGGRFEEARNSLWQCVGLSERAALRDYCVV